MTTSSVYGRRHRAAAAGLVVCLGASIGALALSSTSGGSAADGPAGTPPETTAAAALVASPPTRMTIDALGVETRVARLGAGADGNLELPPLQRAGWDTTSVSPGERGITVVAGYIRRTSSQPGVLRRLHRLETGDVITLQRADRKTVDYTVTDVAWYPRGEFPAADVFAPVDGVELRLVSTGGGLRDRDALGNAVVYATAEAPDES